MKLLFLLSMFPLFCHAQMPVIDITGGKVKGVPSEDPQVVVYKGIPYAAPPIGEYRWKVPQPVKPWSGIKVADTWGNRAMQPPRDYEHRTKVENFGDVDYVKEFYETTEPEGSEDCLYLNVWTPKDAKPGDKLPVAFWIHGGGFISGYGSEMEFSGDAYARKGVILVTINYRLGIFGYMAHPELDKESPNNVSGNYAVCDQIAALRWVKDNISRFGGDADNVTIFGQSAGAMSVRYLLSSPLAKGLFSKAIIQSGGGYDENGVNTALTTLKDLEAKTLKMYEGKSLAELRSMNYGDLFNGFLKFVMAGNSYLSFVPNIDGYTITGTFGQLINNKTFADVPIMIGCTLDDMDFTKLSEDFPEFSRQLVKNGYKPAYIYQFCRRMPGDGAGAFHSSDLWYMMGTLKHCWRPLTKADYKLSEQMVSYWTNFMKTGNPNGKGLSKWNPCSTLSDVKRLDISWQTDRVIPKLDSICITGNKAISTKGLKVTYRIDQSDALYSNNETYGVSPKSIPVDESYNITISKKKITVSAKNDEGLFRAKTTLLQMGVLDQDGSVFSGNAPDLKEQVIIDKPLFAWRGMSLDVSRHFFTPDEVKTVIDILSLYKFNVLHLHLSDNQGWRIEIKSHPELTAKGPHFTQEEFRDIVDYAAKRFITVVPEVDLPGHTLAVLTTYPELPNASSLPFEFNMPGQALASLDPDDPKTVSLVSDIIREVAAITPGKYMHIGGDETFGMNDDKYKRFITLLRKMVKDNGKSLVAWQEMSRAETGTDDIIQNWICFSKKQMARQQTRSQKPDPRNQKPETNPQNQEAMQKVIAMLSATYRKAPQDVPAAISAGAKILLSPNAFCYMDCPYEEESTDTAQSALRKTVGLQQYAPQNLQDMYDWNPLTFLKDVPVSNIAGVEAAMWCETIKDKDQLQMMILPRLTIIAEKAWNGGSTSWTDYSHRLASQSPIWQSNNWNFYHSTLIDWK